MLGQKKYTYFILIFVVTMLLLPAVQTALALELNYPSLPFGNITPNSNAPTLPEFIAYIFYFFISVSGIIGVIAIAIAGFEFLVSAGNETLITDAKDRIRSAVFGIILLMCVFIVIRTINPDLLNLRSTLQRIALQNGVYVVLPQTVPAGGNNSWGVSKNNHNLIGIPYARAQEEGAENDSDYYDDYDYYENGWAYYESEELNEDTQNDQIPEAVGKYLYFKCSPDQQQYGAVVTVQIYYKKGFTEDSAAKTVEMQCEGRVPLDRVLSYKWKVREPGIYLYSKSGCQGDSSYDGITSNQDVPDDFLDVKSLKIINDPQNEIYWGLVMNAASGFRGECSQPAINITKNNVCVSVSLKFIPHFMNVFQWNSKYDNRKNYQNGLSLYGMPVEIEAPPAGAGNAAAGATCYASTDCADGLTCGCLGGGPCGSPDEPAGICEPRSGDQDYYYISGDKIQNHWYYVQEGYADHKAGYFTQLYYNISAQEIINKINENGKGYYTCLADPGLLLKDGPGACDAGTDPGTNNICEVVDPLPSESQKNCLTPNSPYCIQSITSRDQYLYMLYAQNENGDNRTCSMFSEDTIDLQKIDFRENGKELYRLNIIPIR